GRNRARREHQHSPERGLLLDREIENGAEAERDREPGRQPSRSNLRQHPPEQPLRGAAGKTAEAIGPDPCRRAGSRPPRCRPRALPLVPVRNSTIAGWPRTRAKTCYCCHVIRQPNELSAAKGLATRDQLQSN